MTHSSTLRAFDLGENDVNVISEAHQALVAATLYYFGGYQHPPADLSFSHQI